MKTRIQILFIILLFPFVSGAQLQNITLNGYVKDLFMFYKPEIQIPGIEAEHLSTNIIHNRLNFRWYANNELTFTIEARNRVFFGQMIREFPVYQTSIDVDRGYFDLSEVIASGDGWFIHSIIDRAWLNYSSGNWSITAGRQRINWGVNLVWNPNDIFNSFSYFDFDYEERPGTDAVKIQYYTGVTSSAELVYKIGKNTDETSIAGMYRFSKFSYDFQFLGAWAGKDFVIGGGWAGNIKGGGFRGEASWFIPRTNDNGSEEAFVASVSGDYTMKNSLYLHTGILFSSNGTTGKAGGREIFDLNLSAKMLSLAKYNIFAQMSYPITPLFSANLSGMLNPSDGSSYISPSLTYSLANNWEFMLTSQLFTGDSDTEYGDYGKFIFARLKWAF
ncbi:hypothetical protein [Maribellus maritimus]|uniref:hypothetical protein n=1 Tax=Maribellus maritimus TaxID=2870838 RepID=UPI001EEBE9C3|nr:hypothetical protein [Maribellus maritimus]MCG6189283.1 hypothetical protein [Maribellus maritimus]